MTLPKIEHPIYTFTLPSTKKKLKFRPFLVKEEKLLLMAKESGEQKDMLNAFKQIVNNCCLEPNFDIDSIAIFDLEYLFIKLRSVSVGNICKVVYRDKKDSKDYEFDIDLDKVEVEFPKDANNKIEINDKMGIIMKYPSALLYEKDYLEDDEAKKYPLFELILRCIDKIYDGEEVYQAKDYKIEDLRKFIEHLGGNTFNKIQDFLVNLPSVKHVIEYQNSLKEDRKIILTSLSDFFIFR